MAHEGLTKEQAETKIEELLKESNDKIKEAMGVADMYALEFGYEPDHIGTYYGTGTTEGAYNYDDEPVSEGYWYPSSWSSSSIYC